MLGGICEPKVLAACAPALETEVSDAMLLEVRVSCGFSCELGKAALEGDALVSGCAVEPSWEEVTLVPGCWTMDEWVACGKPSSPVS